MPKPKPAAREDTDVELQRELKRWGMSEGEIASAVRKQKRRDALVMSAVKSKRTRTLPVDAHAIPLAPQASPPVAVPVLGAEGLCTVRFAAEQLGLHRKTVLRFIREGKLPARRVGKSYRIRRSDLGAFAGVPEAAAPSSTRPSLTSIFEIPGVEPATAQRWMTVVMAMLKGRPAGSAPMRAEVVYEEARSLVKIVVVGPPEDALPLLEFVRRWGDSSAA